MWKRLVVFGLLLICLSILMPTLVLADSSDDITVIVTGWICEAPGGFTLTYISDYEIGISWTKGEGVENTMIRAKYGSYPVDRTDGYLVYYGDGTTASDTGVNFEEGVSDVYYRAWGQNADGFWEEVGTTNFMENPYMLLIALVGLSLGIAVIAIWRKHPVLYIAAFIGCLLIATHLAETSLVLGVPIGLMSGYMLWSFIMWWF